MSENRSSSPGVKDNAESSASPRSEDVLRSIGLNVCAEVTPQLSVSESLATRHRQGSGAVRFGTRPAAHSITPLCPSEPAVSGLQDADLALARTLQEQERAFMLFAAQHQQHQRCHPLYLSTCSNLVRGMRLHTADQATMVGSPSRLVCSTPVTTYFAHML